MSATLAYTEEFGPLLLFHCDMLVDPASGCSLGAWGRRRSGICKKVGIPDPEDVVAWVSGGKSSDKIVTDWSRQFSMR
jgi:hypothetical protein